MPPKVSSRLVAQRSSSLICPRLRRPSIDISSRLGLCVPQTPAQTHTPVGAEDELRPVAGVLPLRCSFGPFSR